jgi:hypothetical protein
VNGSACYLLHDGLLHGLFFDPEDEGNVFLRNDSWLSKTTWNFIQENNISLYLKIFRNIF